VLALRHVTIAARQKIEVAAEMLPHLGWREHLDPGDRELDRERQAVKCSDQLTYVFGGVDVNVESPRSLDEEGDGIVRREHWHLVFTLGRKVKSLAARD
jgi:hypothetical protein